MRDFIVTLLVFGSLPLILRKPFFGVLVWTWLGLMNPHRLCWGFATTMPFAQLVALAILIGWVINKDEKKSIPWTPIAVLLLIWWGWMLFTSFFALADPWTHWSKVWKIMLMTFVAITLLTSRERLHAMVWVCVISLGFYGVKGGIFTITTGGGYAVWGPPGTFIGGNNEIGLALIMTIPLMRYLQLSSTEKFVKKAMLVSMITTFFAIIGTQSRGALVGLVAMVTYLVLKSRKKSALLVLLVAAIPVVLLYMPESWYERMATIETYDTDGSALGRINAWWTAWYVALDHPLTGGGFGVFNPRTFLQYAPKPENFHDAHSIYFEVLGEQGFIGLAIFLSIGVGSLLTLNSVRKFAAQHEQLTWMRDLASMLYVSLIGYAASGAFLGLAYFDYYYTLVAMTSGVAAIAARYRKEGIPAPAVEPPVPDKGVRNAGWKTPEKTIFKRAADWYQKM